MQNFLGLFRVKVYRKVYKKSKTIRRVGRVNKNSSAYKNNILEYQKYKEECRKLARERLEYYNAFYNFKYNKIIIKNQKTKWGSCSSLGNLNFNYKILFLTERQRDYIIVHELCHIRQMNHSKDFWVLVEQTFPDYAMIRGQLKKINLHTLKSD